MSLISGPLHFLTAMTEGLASHLPFYFVTPLWLWACPLLFLPFYIDQQLKNRAVALASISVMVPRSLRRRPPLLRHGGWFLRTLAMAFVIVALARPQVGTHEGRRVTEGVDIMLAIDTSGSMAARDFEVNGERPDRLEVIKSVIADFIEARPDDRIGMVVFGNEAFTQAPLTLDHEMLKIFLDQIKIGVAGDATAIGDGIATCVKRLKEASGKSHVIILLTDGANNTGRIDPMAATQAAKALGIRIHTIGVGSEGMVPIVKDGQVYHIKADIDEEALKNIANETGGIYRRAMDTGALVNVYKDIDRLEKNRREDIDRRQGRDVFSILLSLAASILALEALWRCTRYRRIPS